MPVGLNLSGRDLMRWLRSGRFCHRDRVFVASFVLALNTVGNCKTVTYSSRIYWQVLSEIKDWSLIAFQYNIVANPSTMLNIGAVFLSIWWESCMLSVCSI